MKPFSRNGAQYFVSKFSADAFGKTYSVDDYLTNYAHGVTNFTEGTSEFNQLKDCLLREAERSLLMSASCYARALDNLREGSVYWAVVGLYYAAFLSSKAVLGMHGCWMSQPRSWIEVVDENPGKQKMIFKKTFYPNNGGQKGSHKVTWIAFYEAMNHLSAWLTSPQAVLAINPVNSSKVWMIETRNDVNYNPQAAFEMMSAFQASYDPTNVPHCFSGKLQTMLRVAQAFVMFAKEIAIDYGLNTDVWSPAISRKDWCKKYVTSPQDPALLAFAETEYPALEF